MTEADKATLASIANLLISERISVAKALDAAFLVGELSGKVEMAKVGQGIVNEAFAPVLDILSGKVKP